MQKKESITNNNDILTLGDLLHLCRSRWTWFVVSLIICMALAVCYLLIQEPVYTRTAAILIKDDSKGKSVQGDFENFSDLGLFTSNTNVYNEMGTLQSPDMMREVISLLHLDVDYHVDGKFHKETVYDTTLPVKVAFLDIGENESGKFELRMQNNGTYSLVNFVKDDEEIMTEVLGKLNDTVQTPLGRLTVFPTNYVGHAKYPVIYVTRKSIPNTIIRYKKNLAVMQIDDKSNIITLRFNDVSIKRAEDILATHIDVYNRNWVKDKNQIAVSTSLFINERLGVIENELGNVDDSISSYKSEHLLPDVQATASMYISQASEAEAVIRELNTQVYMANYIHDYLTDKNNKFQVLPSNSGIENQGITAQINEYNKQLIERNSLVANSSTKNPLVVQMDSSLESLRSALVSSINNELVSLEAKIKSQQKYSGRATSQIASNPKQAKYLLSVERQQKVKEALYLYLLQKREENELNQAFTAYNTRIITQPGGSMLPSAPKTTNILLVAFALGLLIPIILIFVKETSNTVVRGRKDIEKLSIPLIGEIPLHGRKQRRPANKKHLNNVVVKPGNRDIINEAFRVLRTNLEFMNNDKRSQNVMIMTSFNPGSGKSFLSLNIAISLAIKDKKVLVIDGDMRHATASTYVNSPKPGLSE